MSEIKLYYKEVATPIGNLVLLSTSETMIRIDFGQIDFIKDKIASWVKRYLGEVVYIEDLKRFKEIEQELNEYFRGNRQTFTFPFVLYGTDFQKAVWHSLLQTVPYGNTKTYGEIAKDIQNPKAVRAVGGAVNKNPFSIVVPCHRIIGQTGDLVGYGGGLDKKEKLLIHEGYLIS